MAEYEAIEEISSYIRARYIVDEIFKDTKEYGTDTLYYGKDVIQYTLPTFTTGTTYSQYDRFNYKGLVYEQITSGTTSGSTNPSTDANYSYITENNSFYTAKLPVNEYNQTTNYIKDQLVWYKNEIWQATQEVRGQRPGDSQNLELRYGIPSVTQPQYILDASYYPQQNPIPGTNPSPWISYSGEVTSYFTGNTYSFSGELPTNTTYWEKKDGRNTVIVMYLMDIMLYHLLSRINPRAISELRENRYMGAISWLKNVQKGNVSLTAPEILPTVGQSIMFGSYPKRNTQNF
jgi:hypothetical protein